MGNHFVDERDSIVGIATFRSASDFFLRVNNFLAETSSIAQFILFSVTVLMAISALTDSR